MVAQIITRAEAKEQGLKYYFTGKPCKRGHIDYRYTSGRNCYQCRKLEVSDPEYHKKYHKQWYNINKPDRLFQIKEYRDNNRHIYCEASSKRRAKLLQATPKWLTIDHWNEIKLIYKEAAKLGFHVDHTVPLNPRCKTVCGLHVPWNLQPLPPVENHSKNDCWWPNDWS